MLKIKDNVDLKELEKFGFKYYDDKKNSYYGCAVKQIEHTCIFINNSKVISISNSKSIFELDLLYDLIKADLVKRVDE